MRVGFICGYVRNGKFTTKYADDFSFWRNDILPGRKRDFDIVISKRKRLVEWRDDAINYSFSFWIILGFGK